MEKMYYPVLPNFPFIAEMVSGIILSPICFLEDETPYSAFVQFMYSSAICRKIQIF